jgi:hypothetical protein
MMRLRGFLRDPRAGEDVEPELGFCSLRADDEFSVIAVIDSPEVALVWVYSIVCILLTC